MIINGRIIRSVRIAPRRVNIPLAGTPGLISGAYASARKSVAPLACDHYCYIWHPWVGDVKEDSHRRLSVPPGM